MKKIDIKELRNGQDFKDFYLKNVTLTFCEQCNAPPFVENGGFLEIAKLENLKKQQKNIEGRQTRRKFYSMVLLSKGEIIETIGHQKYHFKANSMYFVAENQLQRIERWSDDVMGIYCMFDADYFLLCLKHQIKLNQFPFFQLNEKPFVDLSERESSMMEHLFWKLNHEKCQKKTFNDDLLTRLFLNVILLEVERIYTKRRAEKSISLSRKDQLVARFQMLVAEHLIETRQVNGYAEMLHVHPNYLNDIVKEATGLPASHFIQTQLVQEAKSRLLQTNDTVSMISMELNFANDSYFGRFFKKLTGLTPTQFRKNHKH